MRIAVATWTLTKFGGAETYVEQVLAGLVAAGHSVALFTEARIRETGRPAIALPEGVPAWCLETEDAFAALAAWKPDFIFDQTLSSIENTRRLLRLAPCALYSHNYYGACISGGKLWSSPELRCCDRTLGWGCLLHYYPHRCGGRHPLRVIANFRAQTSRRDTLPEYRGIFVASRRMKLEYERQGLPPERVRLMPYPMQQSMRDRAAARPAEADIERRTAHLREAATPLRLLFVGRMEGSKGGTQAIGCLAAVAKTSGRPIELTMCGEGSQRAAWEAEARALERRSPSIRIRFPGWLSKGDLDTEYRAAQALLVPSVWPEPFGLVGLEAGLFGLPSVAFAVGGIPDWLREGETGTLAPGEVLEAAAYGDALLRLVRSPEFYARCGAGALGQARGWIGLPGHVRELEDGFRSLQLSGAGEA